MGRKLFGILFAVISALTFGIMPLMTQTLYDNGLNAISIIFHRLWIAPLFLLVYITIKGYSLRIKLSYLPFLTLTSFFGFVMTPLLLYTSYHHINTGVATTLHFLYPVFVVLLSIVVLKRGINVNKIIALILAMIGMIIFTSFKGKFSMEGFLLAAASSITYAIFIVLMATDKIKRTNEIVAAFYMALIGAVMVGVKIFISGEMIFPSTTFGMVHMVIFAFIIGILGGLMLQLAVARVGAQTTSILSAFEPITSIIIGVVFLKEQVTSRMIVGVLFILTAVIMVIISEARAKLKYEDKIKEELW